MDLLLWRHAEAVDGIPDAGRELTQRGLKQANRMAEWLHANRPKRLRVLVSPTLRTRQTAAAFAENFEIVPALGTDASVAGILAATGWPDGAGDPSLRMGAASVLAVRDGYGGVPVAGRRRPQRGAAPGARAAALPPSV